MALSGVDCRNKCGNNEESLIIHSDRHSRTLFRESMQRVLKSERAGREAAGEGRRLPPRYETYWLFCGVGCMPPFFCIVPAEACCSSFSRVWAFRVPVFARSFLAWNALTALTVFRP